MEKITITRAMKSRGVLAVYSHTDDEALGFGQLEQFADAGVPITILMMTLGEKGIPKGSELTEQDMKNIRGAEFRSAATYWDANPISLDLGDSQLSLQSNEVLVPPVLAQIRRLAPAAILTIHPNEVTPHFDHVDHNRTADVVRIAANGMDVTNFYPEYTATHTRSQLFFWTTNPNLATNSLKLSKSLLKRRDDYLMKYYPSQFKSEAHEIWRAFFDRINAVKERKGKIKGIEYWTQVR